MDGILLFDGSVSSSTGLITPTSVNSGVTFAVGTTDSANIIDVSQIAGSASGYGRDVGIGDDPALEIFVGISTAFTSSNAATMAVSLQTAPDNSGTPGSYTNLVTTPALPVASLVAGLEIFKIKMPAGIKKFIKLVYTVAAYNMITGGIIAGIVLDRSALGPLMGYQSGYSNTYL
jgi:hypothetical protein